LALFDFLTKKSCSEWGGLFCGWPHPLIPFPKERWRSKKVVGKEFRTIEQTNSEY